MSNEEVVEFAARVVSPRLTTYARFGSIVCIIFQAIFFTYLIKLYVIHHICTRKLWKFCQKRTKNARVSIDARVYV